MKRIFNATMFMALMLCTSDYLSAQWVDSPNGNATESLILDTTTGKNRVGINTTVPRGPLHVKSGNTSISEIQLLIETKIGVDNPDFTLANNGATRCQFKYDNATEGLGIFTDATKTNLTSVNTSKLGLFVSGDNQSVGVKTSVIPAGYDMAIAGKVICEEMRVQLQANWPDYVFQPEYELMPLDELEASIEANNHLPGVPSAALVEAEGFDLGDMSKIQMEKIEELTLYLLELKKENDSLRARVEKLEAK